MVQDAIAPGHWLGQFVGINSKTEKWEFASSSPAEVSAALVGVLNGLTPERRSKLLIPEFKIARADAANVHVLTWTKAEWLDTGADKDSALAEFHDTGLYWVEDKPKNAIAGLKYGLKPILIDHPYNQDLQHPDIIRVSNWKQIHEIVSGKIKK